MAMRKLGQRRVYLNLRFNDKSHLGAVNIRSVRVVLELAMFVIFYHASAYKARY